MTRTRSAVTPAPRDDAGERVALMVRTIQADLRREWSVSDMAAILGVSAGQLRRLFTRALGATPRQVLCNLRLEAAARLLRNPGMRVKEIQGQVGIADPSHFCRDFRDRYGVSPTEYRRHLHARGDSFDTDARRGQEKVD